MTCKRGRLYQYYIWCKQTEQQFLVFLLERFGINKILLHGYEFCLGRTSELIYN